MVLNEEQWIKELREKRIAYGISQGRLAVASGITREYLNKIESGKMTQPAQPVHRQNVEKVVSQETRQNYKAERTTKKQTFEQSKRTTEHTEKNRNLVTKKGQKKK